MRKVYIFPVTRWYKFLYFGYETDVRSNDCYKDPRPNRNPWRKDSLRGTTDTGFNFCVDDWDRKDNNLMYAIKLGAML